MVKFSSGTQEHREPSDRGGAHDHGGPRRMTIPAANSSRATQLSCWPQEQEEEVNGYADLRPQPSPSSPPFSSSSSSSAATGPLPPSSPLPPSVTPPPPWVTGSSSSLLITMEKLSLTSSFVKGRRESCPGGLPPEGPLLQGIQCGSRHGKAATAEVGVGDQARQLLRCWPSRRAWVMLTPPFAKPPCEDPDGSAPSQQKLDPKPHPPRTQKHCRGRRDGRRANGSAPSQQKLDPKPHPPRTQKHCRGRRDGRRAKQRVEELAGPPEAPGRGSTPRLEVRVVDSYGDWAALWESQFSALKIPHLRSHTLVHTEPFNKKALQDFAVSRGREAELQRLPQQGFILDGHAFFSDARLGPRERSRLHMPTGCAASCDQVVLQVERYGLDGLLMKGTVDSITPVMTEAEEEEGDEEGHSSPEKEEEEEEEEGEQEGAGRVGASDGERDGRGSGRRRRRRRKRVEYFRVLLQDGVTLEARQVVVATGPTRAQMANIPGWVERISEDYPEERLQHTVSLMHHLASTRCHAGPHPGRGQVCEAGQRLMVIGGGLTSAHIVSIALQQGASHVTWVMRKHMQLKQFDVGDVEGLVGRYAHVEHGIKLDGRAYLGQFYGQKSLLRRLAMIRQARKGGAVSPEAYVQLKPFIQSGQVDLHTYCQVSQAKWCYRRQVWSVALCTGAGWTGDRIWLATGCRLDARQDPLLSGVMEGWPCVTEALQWAPGCPLYVMGQYAALQVGPHAVNLAGGQAASMRIAADVLRRQQRTLAREAGGESNARPQIHPHLLQSYVQQMHGLMWL
ncbi:hypothetical protein CRUP_010515 [Coryphaenoides rupestris]|nr:hypothetical protein CRUP_010515 [Coryphaenoides rupestris]